MNEHLRSQRKFRQFAASRDGVFTRGQALEGGLSEHQVKRAQLTGEWERYRGVLKLAGSADSPSARLRAALLRAGGNALATGTSALRLYGFDGELPDRTQIIVPIDNRPRLEHVDVLRDLRTPDASHWFAGIPCVDQQRAAIDAMRLLPVHQSRDVMYRALQTNAISLDQLERACYDFKSCRGVAHLHELLRDARTGAHAESERLFHRLLEAAGLTGWVANSRIYGKAGLIGVVDVSFGEAKLAIEIDGRAWHSKADRFQRDRTKQNRLSNHGWSVLRFTWYDIVHRPDYVIETILAQLDNSHDM